MNGRRRGRDEFERDNGSPPSAYNRQGDPKRTTFAVRGEVGEGPAGTGYEEASAYQRSYQRSEDDEDWRRGLGGREKREEFLRLCERAWDLFHS